MNAKSFRLTFLFFLMAALPVLAQNSNTVVDQWTTPGALGGTTEYTKYADGRVVSKTIAPCYTCKGDGICKVCNGTGGRYYSATQIYYPCTGCAQSGKCKYCKGEGVQITYSTIDQNGNGGVVSNNGLPAIIMVDGEPINGPSKSNSQSSASNSPAATNAQRKANCPDCKGTGLWHQGNQPEYAMPLVELIAKYNSEGEKCSKCGSYDEHWHSKCITCLPSLQ